MIKRVVTATLLIIAVCPACLSAADIPGWSFGNGISSNDFTVVQVGTNRISVEYNRSEPGNVDGNTKDVRILIPLSKSGLPAIEVKSATYESWRKDTLLESGTIIGASAQRDIHSLVTLKQTGTVRYWRLGTFSLKPYRLDYEGKFQTNRIYRSIRFDLVYPEDFEQGTVQDPLFLSSLRKLPVLDQLPMERLTATEVVEPDPALWSGSLNDAPNTSALRIATEEEGLVFVPLVTDGTEEDIRLTHQARDVDFLRTDIPEDGIIFHAEKSDSPFSRESVYWLTSDRSAQGNEPVEWSSAPRDFQISSKAPSIVSETIHLEEDHELAQNADRCEAQAQYWYWSSIDGATKESFSVAVPDIASETFSLSISLGADHSDSASHFQQPDWTYLSFWLDEKAYDPIGSASKSLEEGYEITIDGETSNVLSATEEEMTLSVYLNSAQTAARSETASSAYLNSIDVRYDRYLRFDGSSLQFVGNPAMEKQLPVSDSQCWGYRISAVSVEAEIAAFLLDSQGALRSLLPYFAEGYLCIPVRTTSADTLDDYTVFVVSPSGVRAPVSVQEREPAGLRTPTNQADYLLITHEKFVDSAKRLADWHRSKGLKGTVIDVADIYREFGDGSMNPYAIKRFLTYAFRHWEKPAPAYVLLMGDASWDYWGRFDEPVPNYVPGYRVHKDYASDEWYISISGEDYLPDFHIGRISVQETAEAEYAVNKIISYGEGEGRGPWESRAMFFSDNEAGFETGLEEVVRNQVPPVYAKELVLLRDYEFMDNFYMPEVLTIQEKSKTSPKCTSHILEQFDKGCALWEFYGHGSPNVLCHERIFFGGGSKFSEVKKLRNGNRLPFMLLMTCDTGHFDYALPKWNLCIVEELMSVQEGGMLGALASTGRGFPGHHAVFFRGFHQSLFEYDIREVGAACTAMKILYKMEETSDDPLLMFQIFGDPASALRVPQAIGTMKVLPDKIQARNGGRLVAIPGEEIDATKLRTAFVSDGAGALLHEPVVLEPNATSVGFDLPEDLAVGTGYATVFSASVEADQDPIALVGSYESLPREPIDEKLASSTASPELSVSSTDITFSDFSPVSGQTVFVTVRVHNNGDRTARDVEVKAYEGDPAEGGTLLTDMVEWPFKSIPFIRPGESEKITLRWDSFQQTGEKEIWAHVDPTNKIKEANEEDNKASRPLIIRKKADLEITGEMKWDDLRERYLLSYSIKNIGEEKADNVLLQLRGYRTPGDPQPVEKDFDVVKEIAPDGVRSGSGIGVPSSFYKIELMVDPDDIVDEETHRNNLLEIVLSEVAKNTIKSATEE